MLCSNELIRTYLQVPAHRKILIYIWIDNRDDEDDQMLQHEKQSFQNRNPPLLPGYIMPMYVVVCFMITNFFHPVCMVCNVVCYSHPTSKPCDFLWSTKSLELIPYKFWGLGLKRPLGAPTCDIFNLALRWLLLEGH